MWGAGASSRTATLSTVTYGVMPPNHEKLLNQADTALTLTAGCYEVVTSGTGRATFDVRRDGTVSERNARR